MNNNVKTVLLLGGLTGLMLLIGSALGGRAGMIFAFIFAVVINMGAWWFSGSIALRLSGAKEVSPGEAPELHRMVEGLAQRANLPKPKVCIIQSPMPNAFATGRDPKNGAVAVTTGIMDLLNRDELAGVIAHELAHIKNRDTLISSVAATIAGAITMIADMVMWSMIFGGFGGDDEDNGMAGVVGGIFMIILAPIAALLIQMAISRSREFVADQGGAEILGDPMPLANALRKLESWSQGAHHAHVQDVKPAVSHLYIVPGMSGGLAGLFRTHPPTEQRVERLEALSRNAVIQKI
ncbi:MAG: zinc metalloprotease HtpX [Anaerolineae bacterium]|jgi:heat shock protein HtpX|nr:zinc metalloprotease HtpX [Anaerolineae bacterium]